jgi:nitroimidazol reductase NimA-like FMN-containing flavoprotein (pyridoxamine 5'-phosphate oxidase superfamily)
MSDRTTGAGSADPGPADDQATRAPVLEPLDEAECLRLIAPGGVGRIVYTGRFDLTVIPVNYKLHEGSIVFRTARDSAMDEDLRTGIAGAEYRVAFEVDDVDPAAKGGWSVLIQGSAHHVDSAPERASVQASGVEPWAGGSREHFIRITPTRITGRRISQA